MGSGEHYCLRWNNHQSNLLGVFSQLLQDESLVDVTLACAEGLSIRAHKVVLSACSSYFQTLFIDHPNRHPIVILKDVCFAELRTLVEFMYKGEVSIEYCQLSALLKTAESLKVKGLAEMTHLNANIKREREETPGREEMENKRLINEDTKVLSPRQSPNNKDPSSTEEANANSTVKNSNIKRHQKDGEEEDEEDDVQMEIEEEERRRGSNSPLRGGCPGPADLSASGLVPLCQPTPTCSSRASSPHSSEAFPGPSCLPPVQQVPLSLKKEVDWERDEKSTAGESSSDYRHPHDAVTSEDELDDKYVTSCSRQGRPLSFPIPFSPFQGLIDSNDQINRVGCSLLNFLSHPRFPSPGFQEENCSMPCPVPGPPTPYRCSLCLAAFPSAWLLEQHNSLQHSSTARNVETGSPGEDKPFRCEQCGQSYRYRSAYLKHQEQNHRARLPADKLFTCDVCGMQFRYLKSFKKHRLNHALERLHSRSPDSFFRGKSNGMAERCLRSPRTIPESSTDLKALNLTGIGKNTESGRVTAPPFTSADSSSDQVTSSNEALGEVPCSDRAASAPAGRTDGHLFKFDEFYCFQGEPKSGKSDSEQDETVDTLAYALNNEAFRFQQEASLMNLLRMESNDRQRDHRFSCPFCGKCVRSKENLKLHIRKHTGERPFVCLFCGRAFGGKSDLTRHLRIHTGERPYHCEMCGKCFARADYLSKHLTTHIHSHNTRPPFLASATPTAPPPRPLQQ